MVVNEWLLEYMRPDATNEQKLLLERFLNKFYPSNDKIVLVVPSPFAQKLYQYSKNFQYDQSCRDNLMKFFHTVLRDSTNSIIYYVENKVEIPLETYHRLNAPGTNFNSDTYLFEQAMLTDSRKIVTTDVRLRDAMQGDDNFEVILLTDFLPTYNP